MQRKSKQQKGVESKQRVHKILIGKRMGYEATGQRKKRDGKERAKEMKYGYRTRDT